ncbi:MAG: NifU family protein [Bacteroidetes bacterium]|jgi:Fe-S cluster biogenesis protein NfuA|nr:MAG: thioredoxin [Cryomorphaceae bacterium BACL23 MAG-120924-bin60]MBL6627583.1 NifU family protein [Cryomorphaceae bacterium]MDA0363920.1 NifU family protein [Bacteroidota bacterium]NCZ94412.1 NifU family protein [Flavobacteriia bacterium]MDA0829186.1 NifU family protein [Bacteroidota bacterium]
MEIQRVPVSVYAEMTPNPAVMKFVANKMVVDVDHVEFHNIEEAAISPLATELFHFPFVKEVFMSSNFIAIQKYNVVEWETVTQEIRQFILDYIQAGKPVLTGTPKGAPTAESEEAPAVDPLEGLGDIELRIVDILEEFVKPAVAQDGGNIAFVAYENKVVKVQLQGACAGCPSSTLTLQQGIKNILQRMLPTLVDDVVPV